jgi:ABC-type nickel/cobalt efflux system permease component RcnA
MTGTIAFNLVNQNSGYADIAKLMTVIGALVVIFLGFWTIVKIDAKIANWWKQRRIK